jgi:hypothetical protein
MMISLLVVPPRYTNRPWDAQHFFVGVVASPQFSFGRISCQSFPDKDALNCDTRYNLLMEFFAKIVEERIQRAQEDGLFDNLSGKGKPLKLEDDSFVPEDLRLTYKILKNSNCLPVEMELRKQIFNLRQLLNAAIDEETRRELRRELNLLVLKFNVKRQRGICVDLLEAPPEGLQK